MLRRFRARLAVAAVLALLLVGGLILARASAQVLPRHTACYAASEPNPSKQWRYLPNPADPCPGPSWVKVDWIDD